MRKHVITLVSIICITIITISIMTGKHFNNNIKEADKQDNKLISSNSKKIEFKEDENKLRGSIFDRNGIRLSYTKYQSDPQEYKRKYCDQADTLQYGLPLSNLIDGYSAQEEGLDLVFEKMLRIKNPTPTKDDAIGESVQLTIDAKLTKNIYDILYDINKSEMNASVVIMKPNGEILAMISTPCFDLEKYKNDQLYRVSLTKSAKLRNANRHLISVSSDFFTPAFNVFFNTDSIKKIGYNRIQKILVDEFLISAEITDPSLFGTYETGCFNLENNELDISLNPVYMCQFMNLCINGKMTHPQLILNTVDTNNYQNVIETKFKDDIIKSISDDKINSFKEKYSIINYDYTFTTGDGWYIFGNITENNETMIFTGAYTNDNTDNSYLINICVDNTDFKGVSDIQTMYELCDKVLILLS